MTETPTPPPSSAQSARSLPYVFFGVGLAVLVVFILWVAQGVLVPLVTAIFLSFVVMSVKRVIDAIPFVGRHLPDAVGFVLSFAVIASVVIGLAFLVRENIGAVLAKAPEYQERFATLAESLMVQAERLPIVPPEALEAVASVIRGFGSGISGTEMVDPDPEVVTAAEDLQRQAFAYARAAATAFTGAVGDLLGALVTTFLYTAFLLIERGRLVKKLNIIAGDGEGSPRFAEDVLNDIGNLVRTYISIKTVIALIVATISFLIMSWRQTDFAGFWALLIFAFGFVPIVGAIIAIALPTILTLVQPEHGGVLSALITLVALVAVEQTISSFVEPRLIGRSLNLSPLIILLSLATWGTLWGFPGMLLCVPITVALLIILSQFEVTRPVAILLSDNGVIAPLRRGRTGTEPA